MYVSRAQPGHVLPDIADSEPIDTFGGRSFIIDYRGQIVGKQEYGGRRTYVGGVIDIEALRYHRDSAQWDNWMKDLRTELYQMLVQGADLSEEPLPRPRADEASASTAKRSSKSRSR